MGNDTFFLGRPWKRRDIKIANWEVFTDAEVLISHERKSNNLVYYKILKL